jgi:hypothetical protein
VLKTAFARPTYTEVTVCGDIAAGICPASIIGSSYSFLADGDRNEGFAYLYQGYNYAYYYNDAPMGFFAPYHARLCATGLIAISTIRAMNRPGIKVCSNCGSVILLVPGCI